MSLTARLSTQQGIPSHSGHPVPIHATFPRRHTARPDLSSLITSIERAQTRQHAAVAELMRTGNLSIKTGNLHRHASLLRIESALEDAVQAVDAVQTVAAVEPAVPRSPSFDDTLSTSEDEYFSDGSDDSFVTAPQDEDEFVEIDEIIEEDEEIVIVEEEAIDMNRVQTALLSLDTLANIREEEERASMRRWSELVRMRESLVHGWKETMHLTSFALSTTQALPDPVSINPESDAPWMLPWLAWPEAAWPLGLVSVPDWSLEQCQNVADDDLSIDCPANLIRVLAGLESPFVFAGHVHTGITIVVAAIEQSEWVVLVFDGDGSAVQRLPLASLKSTGVFQRNGPPRIEDVWKALGCDDDCGGQRLKGANLIDDLIEVEGRAQMPFRRHKVGVLYLKRGQIKEEAFIANGLDDANHPAYQSLLEMLGDRIRLKGWEGYRGGLDVKNDLTGPESVFTTWQTADGAEGELMYHVGTMMPAGESVQQVAKKRHIGNDCVVVVFVEGLDIPFDPTWVASQFIHVYIVVHAVDSIHSRFKVSVLSKDGVSPFGPALPSPPLFDEGSRFRRWIQTKVVNATFAVLKSPGFATRMKRAREGVLSGFVDDFE